MIVVTIELQGAISNKREILGRMIIANDGTSGTPKRGNYLAYVANKRDAKKFRIIKPLRKGRVENYPKLSYNVWRLVSRAILSCFPEEKPK